MLKKICSYTLWILFMVLTISWWLNGFEKKSEDTASIMSSLIELKDKDVEGVKEKLGEPQAIHKKKVYTYKDKLGKYDLLIEDKLKSVVIVINKNNEMNAQEIIKEIDMREDIIEKSVVEAGGIKRVTIYDTKNFSKMEMESDEGKDSVKKIKIIY